MYRLRLTQVPDNGTLQEDGLVLGAPEFGLSGAFLGADVEFGFELQRRMERVYGQVWAAAQASLTCGRCLKDYQEKLSTEFPIMFVPRPETVGQDGDPEDPELSVAFFDGEDLPLGEEIRQELELRLPFAPLCRPDCKGLCTVCGQDRNDSDCGHHPAGTSGAFSALNDLFHPKKEGA
ncbi:MAG TPA: DUF177 domain-containing protein [bacterium]|jgi:uncharacterized metal-binding protein YceD (DUF177 family)|nr:DUF177 domain-containing protein [bacterium]HXC65365.1 DUF177 domain-containing protein [bacterium]